MKRISRRGFLNGAGAALGAAVVPSSVLGRDGAISPGDRITVACIGTGWQGANNVQSFLEEPGAQVVAACDIDSEHLETARQTINEKYGNQDCKTYRFFEEVLARSDIDAVMLAAPDHWHGILGTAAAAAGKDIYGEKPLAQNFAEGQAIVAAVERYGRVWQTGSWQRSRDDFRFACELVRERPYRQSHKGHGRAARRAYRFRWNRQSGFSRAAAQNAGLRALARPCARRAVLSGAGP